MKTRREMYAEELAKFMVGRARRRPMEWQEVIFGWPTVIYNGEVWVTTTSEVLENGSDAVKVLVAAILETFDAVTDTEAEAAEGIIAGIIFG